MWVTQSLCCAVRELSGQAAHSVAVIMRFGIRFVLQLNVGRADIIVCVIKPISSDSKMFYVVVY